MIGKTRSAPRWTPIPPGWDWGQVAAMCRGISAILACPDLASAARQILISCRTLLRAPVASVALLPEDAAGPLLAWLDSRGTPRAARRPRAHPAGRIQAAIDQVGRGYLANRNPRVTGLPLPPGLHGRPANFLAVPLALGGKPVGVICLAGKPGGFTPQDLVVATSFGALATAAHQKCSLTDHLEGRVTRATRALTRANAALHAKVDAYEKVRKSLQVERRFRIAVENAVPVGILVGDGRGCIVHANRAFRKLTGWRQRDLIGCSAPFPFWAPEEARTMANGYRRFLRSDGPPEEQLLLFRKRDGERFDAWLLATRVPGPRGASVGWVASVSDITRQRRTEAALRESESRLRRLSAELLAVEERERKRISRDLHDSLGQTLSALKYRLEEAAAECRGCAGSGSVRGKLDSADRILGGAIEEIRTIVSDLRPSLLDDLGLHSAIGWFCREFRRIHPGIRLQSSIRVEKREIPEPLKTTIFRLLQEALTNVARHSGADRASVALLRRGADLELAVRDNGRGLPPAGRRHGVGIIGMKERTVLSGGSFSIESSAGRGTVVRALWRLPAVTR